MRTIFLSFTLIILSFTVFSQKKQTNLDFEGLKGKVKTVQGSSTYLGTKDEPVKLPKRDYYQIEFYGLDGNTAEELDSERGIKYVYQFVDGYLSMKEVVVDREKAAKIMRGSFRVAGGGMREHLEKPVKTLKPDERFRTDLTTNTTTTVAVNCGGYFSRTVIWIPSPDTVTTPTV